MISLLVVALVARGPLLPVTHVQLDNGLRVVLAPDASASSVMVHVRYEIGAAQQTAGEAGYTHLVERLLFAGTKHVTDFEARIEAAGGWASSETTRDHLSVFEHVPPEALELALWLEAERLATLADSISDAALARAKDEIAAEWRSAYVDQPSSLVAREVQQRLWPARHPNAMLVLGDNVAVPRATRAAVVAFARAHLTPRGATLVIAGNFDTKLARERVTKYFGGIAAPASKRAAQTAIAPPATSTEHVVADPIANVVVAFRMGEPYSPDAIALEVAAHVLAGGRAARLQRRLVDGKLASAVDIAIVRQRGGGELHIQATPLPGVDPARVAAELREEIAKLRSVSTDELQRAKAAVDRDLVFALEGLAFRAAALAAWAAYGGLSLEELRGRYRAVTPAALQRAIATWFARSVTVSSASVRWPRRYRSGRSHE